MQQPRPTTLVSIIERDPKTWSPGDAATVYGSMVRLINEALEWAESRNPEMQAKLLGLLLTVAHVTGPIMGETYTWESAQPTMLSLAQMGDHRTLLKYLKDHHQELR